MAVISLSLDAPPPQLRPLNILRDLPAVANLVETCFAATLDDDGRRYLHQMRASGHDNAFLRWATQVAETASMPLSGFVWEENGEIIGNVSLVPYRRHRHRYFLIANVAVHPEHRRRGIGRLLTLAAIQRAREKHTHEIWLHVRDDNPGAIRLYTDLGFCERARRTSWRLRLDPAAVSPAPALPVSRRRGRDWPLQEQFLRRLYPDELDWYQPLPWRLLRPGLLSLLERFFLEHDIRHWVVRRGETFAALVWMPSGGYDRLLAAVPPVGAEEELLALLLHARRSLASWRRGLALELPFGEYAEALRSAGFDLHRTLLWMRLDETFQGK